MKKIYEKLIKVQEVIKDIKFLQDEIDSLPKKYEGIKKNLNRAQKNIENYQNEIKILDEKIENLEIMLQEEEKKKKMYEESEENDTKAAEMIYNDLTETITKIEKRKKEIEKKKAIKLDFINKIKSEEHLIENLEKELKEEEEYIKEKMEEKIKALKEKEKEKLKIYKEIPEEIVEKFERIIQNKDMKGIVPLYENYCSGCNIILPQAFVNKVRAMKEIVFCPYCSRILYYEDKQGVF